VSYDAVGHGDSEPLEGPWRYAIRSFDHLLDDAFQHLADVVEPFMEQHGCAGGKIFLMGSSMGGLVVSCLQAAYPPVLLLAPRLDCGVKYNPYSVCLWTELSGGSGSTIPCVRSV
jgi:alpha-beta hydrolase superfamily lysophospholipase